MASDEIKLIKNAEKNSILKIEKAKNDATKIIENAFKKVKQ